LKRNLNEEYTKEGEKGIEEEREIVISSKDEKIA